LLISYKNIIRIQLCVFKVTLEIYPEGKRPFGDPGTDGMIILRWIFRKWEVGMWTGSSWLRIGTGGRHL
jgi:hypothetical protein